MIAQPLLTSGPKPQAPQQPQPQNGVGFQSLLSTTDASLKDLAQNSGASAMPRPANAPHAANSNKPKSADASATPYVAAPTPGVSQTASSAVASESKAPGADGASNDGVLPTTDVAAAAGTDQSGGNGNSTAFGADTLNARIVAGAPIYASQPNASLATVPPHLLDAANAHPLPGEPVGKPGDGDRASGKVAADAAATLPASTANAATTPSAAALANHPSINAAANASPNKGDSASVPALPADNSAAATGNDSSTPNASLLAQPNQVQTPPVQVDAAVHTAAPYVPVGEQVALTLKQAIAADNNQIRIQLKPASLGTIDVKLNVGQDGRINAVISADRSDTLNMLKQDAGTLQQALRDAGLNADSNSLSFNLSGGAPSFAQNWSQGSDSNSNGSNGYAGGASDALLGADAAAPSHRLHAGALDIEV